MIFRNPTGRDFIMVVSVSVTASYGSCFTHGETHILLEEKFCFPDLFSFLSQSTLMLSFYAVIVPGDLNSAAEAQWSWSRKTWHTGPSLELGQVTCHHGDSQQQAEVRTLVHG